MPDTAELAAELRISLGQIFRRIRALHALPLGHGAVLGQLSREGPQSTSDLAAAVRVRPQSMAQTVHELEDAGHVARHPDPDDGRRMFVELTEAGRAALDADRRHRDDWLARVLIEQLTEDERAALAAAAPVLRRIAEA